MMSAKFAEFLTPSLPCLTYQAASLLRYMNFKWISHQINHNFVLQVLTARGVIILGRSEFEVRVGPDRVGEGESEEGEAQRRARTQEEDFG